MRKANILLESLYGPGKVIRLLQVQELRCIKCTLYRKKANVYHKLERKRQSIMASACLIRAKFQDLRSCEIRKFQENPWNVWIWWLVPSWPSKTQILMFFGKKIEKVSCKIFHGKTHFAQFREFVYNLLPKIVWGNRFSFLTGSRPLDFTFSENVSDSKDPFALQTDI